jgi:hypothetical protein
MTIAAVVGVVLVAVVGVFQIALALGAPLGKAAWGGKHEGILPVGLRIASGAAGLLVYPLIALFILASTDLIAVDWLPTGKTGMWILTAFFTLGALANFASRSKSERIWGPVSLVIAIGCAIIALDL